MAYYVTIEKNPLLSALLFRDCTVSFSGLDFSHPQTVEKVFEEDWAENLPKI